MKRNDTTDDVSRTHRAGRTLLALGLLALAGFSAPLARADDARVDELERKVDALTQEIADMKLGEVADTTTRATTSYGLGRGASKVYGSRGVSIGGYGEMLYNRFDAEREDHTTAALPDRLDLLRAVIYFGYKFDEKLLFNSEAEFEHAGVSDEAETAVDPGTGVGATELSGEAVIEFAYLDWLLRPEIGVRAGMLLMPVGLVNEVHEPIAFLAATRPEVEQVIIPSTWSANGIGIHGDLPRGLSYRTYLTEGLNATGFNAEEPIRGGRQSGSQSVISHPAWVGRVDWDGLAGLSVGGSLFTGDSWQELQKPAPELDARVTLWDLHGRFERRGFEARALYTQGEINDAATLNAILAPSTPLGDSFYGYYVEAGYDLLQSMMPGSRYRVVPYVRYEKYDTQQDVSGGVPEDPSLEHEIWTFGAAAQPHPNVIFKLDRQQRSSPANTETSRWNAAIGYVF